MEFIWTMKKGSNPKSALSNVGVRRGGDHPSSASLTSCTSPEVQCVLAENSQTGVSSNCGPRGKKQWFVLRATYGRTDKALGALQSAHVETYLPKHYVIKEIYGNRKLVQEPLLPNILFAYVAYEEVKKLLEHPAPTSLWLKFYRDKTQDKDDFTQKHPPATIPDNEMLNFIRLTSVNSEHIMVVPPERCHFKNGDLVRVIEGAFTGVIGRVGRAAGQQRVIVELEGICNVATAYIPSKFIQLIESSEK